MAVQHKAHTTHHQNRKLATLQLMNEVSEGDMRQATDGKIRTSNMYNQKVKVFHPLFVSVCVETVSWGAETTHEGHLTSTLLHDSVHVSLPLCFSR